MHLSRRQCLLRLGAAVAVPALSACGGGGGGAGDGAAGAADPGAPLQALPPADATPVSVRVTEVATGLSSPWSLAFLPEGRMLVTERPGRLRVLSAAGAPEGEVAGLPAVDAREQGGLLDIALDPAFAANRRVYLAFAEPDAADPSLNGTAVLRALLSADLRSLQDATVIFRQRPKVASAAHFGGRLAFDRGGALFVTLGERRLDAERGFAQDPTRGHGKVMRITTDGLPAPDNPVWALAGAQPEIWSLGHRNPQGAAIHPVTGELWVSEHGPQGGDEINRVLAGRNYGWPLVSRGQEYGTTTPLGAASLPGYEDPVWVWETLDGSPWSGGAKSSTAPSGLAFYTAQAVPQWRGSLFTGALAGRSLWRLTLDGDRITGQERLLAERGQRIRDVRQGPDGALWLLTDDGALLRYGP